jgi:hypothetical protein
MQPVTLPEKAPPEIVELLKENDVVENGFGDR